MKEKETLYFVLGLASLSLAYLAFSMSSHLSPVLAFFFIVFLLYPIRNNYYASRLLWIGWIIFGIWFFHTVSDLLFPFIISFVLAYLFEPVVQFLTRLKVSRNIASIIITIFGIGVIVLLVSLSIPFAIEQLGRLALFMKTIPIENLTSALPLDKLHEFGIDSSELQPMLTNILSTKFTSIGTFVSSFLSNSVSNLKNIFSVAIGVIIIPFLSLYFLSDFPKITKTIRSLVPEEYTEKYDEFSGLANKILRQYFRGQIIIVMILFCLYSISFFAAGVPYSLLLASIYSIMSFIPYVGGIISLVVSVFFCLVSEDPFHIFILVAITYGIIHAIENFILVPRIIGKTVELNPIVLFLAIFLFGRFLGLIGVLLAVPLSAFLVAILRKYYIDPNDSKRLNRSSQHVTKSD